MNFLTGRNLGYDIIEKRLEVWTLLDGSDLGLDRSGGHVQRGKQVDGAVAFVRANGGDVKTFEAAFNSDATNEAVEKGNVIYARYQVRGVPALLVNGQYMTSLTQAGSETELFEVVNFLLTKQ